MQRIWRCIHYRAHESAPTDQPRSYSWLNAPVAILPIGNGCRYGVRIGVTRDSDDCTAATVNSGESPAELQRRSYHYHSRYVATEVGVVLRERVVSGSIGCGPSTGAPVEI